MLPTIEQSRPKRQTTERAGYDIPVISVNRASEELRTSVLRELDDGTKKSLRELMATSRREIGDLNVVLEGLQSEGRIVRTSDGFETLFLLRR
jgi:hypothetical protein